MESVDPPEDCSVSMPSAMSHADLRWAEFSLRRRELEARTQTESRGVWFTSPVLIAALSAVVGLVGMGVGAVLQG
jgi:hypothetical protein